MDRSWHLWRECCWWGTAWRNREVVWRSTVQMRRSLRLLERFQCMSKPNLCRESLMCCRHRIAPCTKCSGSGNCHFPLSTLSPCYTMSLVTRPDRFCIFACFIFFVVSTLSLLLLREDSFLFLFLRRLSISCGVFSSSVLSVVLVVPVVTLLVVLISGSFSGLRGSFFRSFSSSISISISVSLSVHFQFHY